MEGDDDQELVTRIVGQEIKDSFWMSLTCSLLASTAIGKKKKGLQKLTELCILLPQFYPNKVQFFLVKADTK